MSVWKWKYKPEKCDHGVCVGDCDICNRDDDEEELLPFQEEEDNE